MWSAAGRLHHGGGEDVQVIRGLADELLDRLVKLDELNAPHLTIADGIAAQAFDIFVYIVDIAPQIGIRETRRIVGAYQLTEDDVLGCADFGDTIGVSGLSVEAHVAGTVEFRWQTKARGFNQLPFRMIVPGTVANFYVTGRCASMTHGAQSAARVHRAPASPWTRGWPATGSTSPSCSAAWKTRAPTWAAPPPRRSFEGSQGNPWRFRCPGHGNAMDLSVVPPYCPRASGVSGSGVWQIASSGLTSPPERRRGRCPARSGPRSG